MHNSTACLCFHIQSSSACSYASCPIYHVLFCYVFVTKKICFTELVWQFQLKPAFPPDMIHFSSCWRPSSSNPSFLGMTISSWPDTLFLCTTWSSAPPRGPTWRMLRAEEALKHTCGFALSACLSHLSSRVWTLQSTSSKLITKSDLTLSGVIVNMARRRILMTRIVLFSSSSVLWIDPKPPNESKKRILREKRLFKI